MPQKDEIKTLKAENKKLLEELKIASNQLQLVLNEKNKLVKLVDYVRAIIS